MYLTEQDLREAAALLGVSAAQFGLRYARRTRRTLRLRKPRDRQYAFLRDGGCAIHPAKPTQCRLYPFWPERVSDSGAWKRGARLCPGMGCGGAISRQEALARADRMRRAYPAMYGD